MEFIHTSTPWRLNTEQLRDLLNLSDKAVLFPASDMSSHMTGSQVIVGSGALLG